MQIVFEKLGVENFRFAESVENILYSEGRQTGIVVDVGEQNCYAAAMFEGHHTGFLQLNGVSGREINHTFAQQYADKCGIYFTKSFDRETIVRDIKEQCTRVSIEEEEAQQTLNYQLPSGQVLAIDN